MDRQCEPARGSGTRAEKADWNTVEGEMARVALRESNALVTHDELFADRVKTERRAQQNGVDCFFIALTCFANFAGYSVHALRASAADAIQALVNDGTYGLRIPTTTVLLYE